MNTHHFYCSRNDIGDEGAEAIAEVLEINTKLTKLGLEGDNNNTFIKLFVVCSIGDDGAEALAGALRTNDSLTELDLNETIYIY